MLALWQHFQLAMPSTFFLVAPFVLAACAVWRSSFLLPTMLLNATLTLWTFGDSILDCGR